jgi:hypothetical protein
VAFDDAVDGFGASVVGPLGGEVGHELVAPARSVRPSRAISGIGQLGSDSKAEVAILLPSAKLATKPETRRAAERGTILWGAAQSCSPVASQLMLYLTSPTRARGVGPCQRRFDLVSQTGFEPALPP